MKNFYSGLAQAVDPQVVEFAATKLSDGYQKYAKNKKHKEKKKDEGNTQEDDQGDIDIET